MKVKKANASKFPTYKGKPLVRCGNTIYYGDMKDPYVIGKSRDCRWNNHTTHAYGQYNQYKETNCKNKQKKWTILSNGYFRSLAGTCFGQ